MLHTGDLEASSLLSKISESIARQHVKGTNFTIVACT